MEDKMRDKKDKAIVVVIGQITTNQAGQLLKEFIKVKQKYAPNGRGTIATGLNQMLETYFKGKIKE